MEKEQLEKKVTWLDQERRKASEIIAEQEKRLAVLEKALAKEQQGIKALDKQSTHLAELPEKLDEFEKRLNAFGIESKKEIQDFEKRTKLQEKSLQQEQKGLNKLLEDFRKEVGELQILHKGLNDQGEKLGHLTAHVDVLDESIKNVISGEQRRGQLALSLEESSKQDAQRLTEMHAEVASLLSRLESAAKKTESMLSVQRKMDKRMDELAAAEQTRRTEQKVFFDNALSEQDERQRVWKDWGKRFEQIEVQSTEIAAHLKDIETTDLAVKRAQRAFDELVEKINRRINELTEIQRLGDQRFRQEWSTFQADGQKRWSNFALTHEEQQREGARQQEKLAGQVGELEDSLREVQDTLQYLSEQSERNLQTLLEMARDSLAEHERFLSSNSR